MFHDRIFQQASKQASKFSLSLPLLVIASLFSIATPAQAELQSRAGGTMYYDTVRNVTWIADADLFNTLSGGIGPYTGSGSLDYAQSIIDANNSLRIGSDVYKYGLPQEGYDYCVRYNCTPKYDGTHYDLKREDFYLAGDGFYNIGQMTWMAAQAWVTGLNYAGFSDWRLPETELMKELFFYTKQIIYNPNDPNDPNEVWDVVNIKSPAFALFSNIDEYSRYWTDRYGYDYFEQAGSVFEMPNVDYGNTLIQMRFHNFAMVVRDGDVAAVPVPGTAWLMGSGLLGLLGCKRRHRAA